MIFLYFAVVVLWHLDFPSLKIQRKKMLQNLEIHGVWTTTVFGSQLLIYIGFFTR